MRCDSLPQTCDGSASASSISRPAQRSLALRPARSRDPFAESFTPEASAASLLPRLLWLLPAGAKEAGQDSHPLEVSALGRGTHANDLAYKSARFVR